METPKNIRGLSPDAWEALKWRFSDAATHAIVLKDDIQPNGNYERGEAYLQESGKAERRLKPEEAERFESKVLLSFAEMGIAQWEVLAEDGKNLKTLLEGKGQEATRAARGFSYFAEGLFGRRFSFYITPLKQASDRQQNNAEISFAAAEVLFAGGKFLESIPYFLRANVYANFSEVRERLVEASFEIGDWSQMQNSFDLLGPASKEKVKEYLAEVLAKSAENQNEGGQSKAIGAIVRLFPEEKDKMGKALESQHSESQHAEEKPAEEKPKPVIKQEEVKKSEAKPKKPSTVKKQKSFSDFEGMFK